MWLEYINNKSFNVHLYKTWFVVTSLSNMKKLKAKFVLHFSSDQLCDRMLSSFDHTLAKGAIADTA